MMVKGGYISRVMGSSSEGEAGTLCEATLETSSVGFQYGVGRWTMWRRVMHMAGDMGQSDQKTFDL
jgi:hypothetical protein